MHWQQNLRQHGPILGVIFVPYHRIAPEIIWYILSAYKPFHNRYHACLLGGHSGQEITKAVEAQNVGSLTSSKFVHAAPQYNSENIFNNWTRMRLKLKTLKLVQSRHQITLYLTKDEAPEIASLLTFPHRQLHNFSTILTSCNVHGL